MRDQTEFRGGVRRRPAPAPPPREAWDEGAMSTREVAEFYSCSTRTVYKMQLPYALLDGQRRYPRKLVVGRLSGGDHE